MPETAKLLWGCAAVLLFMTGLAGLILYLAGGAQKGREKKQQEGELSLTLDDPDRAEMQLRSFLWRMRCGSISGRATVLAKNEESYIIAGKILRKYPNIGLLYREDLHYNIK